MVEPIIRVKDIAWIRLWPPDLDVAEEYLRDFGLLRAERTANALYMRGTDPVHHIHITEKGDPKVERIAFWAKSEDDLHQLSRDAAELRRSRHSTSPAGRLSAEVVHVLQEPAMSNGSARSELSPNPRRRNNCGREWPPISPSQSGWRWSTVRISSAFEAAVAHMQRFALRGVFQRLDLRPFIAVR